jgi:hypothetical protein
MKFRYTIREVWKTTTALSNEEIKQHDYRDSADNLGKAKEIAKKAKSNIKFGVYGSWIEIYDELTESVVV